MSDCSICCDTYNKVDRKTIKCIYCAHECCLKCQRRYLLSSAQEAHCMNCKKKWSRKILVDTFPQVFVHSEYALHKENLLFDREKSLLPDTQNHIPIILKKRGLQRMLELCSEEAAVSESRRAEIQYLQSLIGSKLHSAEIVKKDDSKRFTMKCPIGDCRGFLSSRYKCGLCGGKVCPDCQIELSETEEKHDCDPSTVETVKEIKKSTRNCPSCHVPIYKSSGCDQMWCVSCQTAFNWKTGQIEKGIIHNPEYFEFLRSRGIETRNPNEQRCGGLPNYHTVMYMFRSRLESDFVTSYYQSLAHLRNDTLARLPTPLDNHSNLNLRIDYMLNEIPEEEFKKTLYLREKERDKKLDYRQQLDTYITVGEELMRQFATGQLKLKFMAEQQYEIEKIINTQILDLNKIYKCKLHTLALSSKAVAASEQIRK